jgi:hypothetical protein
MVAIDMKNQVLTAFSFVLCFCFNFKLLSFNSGTEGMGGVDVLGDATFNLELGVYYKGGG